MKNTKPSELSRLPALEGYPKLTPPSPLSFPTFKDLVQEDQTPRTRSRRDQGLFSALLGDDTAALWDDATRYPTKYAPEALELLEALVGGRRKASSLTPEERRVLDLAVLDYSGPAPVVPPPKRPPAPAPKKVEEPVVVAQPRPGIDVPETEMPAYWWV